MRRLALSLLLILSACASSSPSQKTDTAPAASASTRSLYDRLGGKDAIGAVVDEMLARVAADTRINARFANADLPKLRNHLVDQICEATGGPCKYTGMDMKTAHKGMMVSGEEFDALVEDLKGALDKYKVGAQEQSELIAALGGMKPDIVNQ